MFSSDVKQELGKVAMAAGIEPAAFLAVAEVESGGIAFAVVDGEQRPLVRFEGHYFDRRLSADDRAIARAAGLSSAVPGGVANPRAQAARWRLIARAAAIDPRAAHESVSWGIGQVMGAHWSWLGYGSVGALVAEAKSGVGGQARLMLAYIEKAGLATALRQRDWAAFARGYNGPGFRRNAYDAKLAAAYRRHRATGSQASDVQTLQAGSAGPAVEVLQRSLAALGYPLVIDGHFGANTLKAVRAFQVDQRLTPDGVAGPRTLRTIETALPFGSKSAGAWVRLLAWLARLFG